MLNQLSHTSQVLGNTPMTSSSHYMGLIPLHSFRLNSDMDQRELSESLLCWDWVNVPIWSSSPGALTITCQLSADHMFISLLACELCVWEDHIPFIFIFSTGILLVKNLVELNCFVIYRRKKNWVLKWIKTRLY